MPQELRNTYTGGRFAFEFDDKASAGFVSGIDGAHFKSDPITYQQGADRYVSKYAGRAKYDDITISVGAAMSPTFWKWVSASLEGNPQRRNGALVGYDFDFCERSRRSFFAGLIAEVGFPALDAASKNAAGLSIKITPEHIEYKKGDGHKLTGGQAQDQMTKQKKWLTSNFRFSLERFKNSDAMKSVKVEAFTVKQNIIDNPVGSEMYARKEVGRLELPQIVVTFPESQMEEWMKWWDEAVAKGDRKGQYTTGVITYYGSDMKSELMHIELDGVSLVSVELDKYEAHKEAIATAKATLNVEGLALKTGEGTV
ncbi:MAG TPA: phage tail protein [Polyangia bacterium]